jgi:aldose 1-epimerase
VTGLSGPPSGAQYEISFGPHRAVVVELGGGLRTYRVGEREVLDGYPVEAMCDGARGQLLVPWPNRLAGGSYSFAGETLQLPLSEPGAGNAIHGLLRWVNFELRHQQADSVTLGYRLYPQPGWPFQADVEVEYSLSDAGLRVRTTATNTGREACPYGTGAHPYLAAGPAGLDGDTLQFPAARYYPVDDAKIPVGCDPVDGTDFDFREPRRVGSTQLDLAYTGLGRDPDGLVRVHLTTPEGRAAVWMDSAYDYLEIFTGDSLPDPARRRTGLGVEPMTCAPNAYRSGEGLVRLEPGSSHVATWGIEVGDGS